MVVTMMILVKVDLYVQWLKECVTQRFGECVFLVPPAHGWASLTRPQYHMTDNTARARGEEKKRGCISHRFLLNSKNVREVNISWAHLEKRMIVMAGDGVLWQW